MCAHAPAHMCASVCACVCVFYLDSEARVQMREGLTGEGRSVPQLGLEIHGEVRKSSLTVISPISSEAGLGPVRNESLYSISLGSSKVRPASQRKLPGDLAMGKAGKGN